jgi:hypothetical protein
MKRFDLQINLSPRDIDYANKNVPYIVKNNKENVKDVILVVDCCRPQKTKIIDPESSFPKNEFNKKVERVSSISDSSKKEGEVVLIYDITPDSEILNCI